MKQNKYRPETFGEIVGMVGAKEKISYAIRGSVARGTKLPHFLISGPSGLGKTTLANIISLNTNGTVHKILGTNIRKPDDIYNLANQCKDGDIIYMEESHGIAPMAQTVLLPWLEDGDLIGGFAGRTTAKAPNVCFIFPTTDAGKLSEPLRNRCLKVEIDYYSVEELSKIIATYCINNNISINNTDNALMAINLLAKSSRGTPRTAIGRIESLLNVMKIDNVELTMESVNRMFEVYGVNEYGLDSHDISYLQKLYKLQKELNGHPVGFKTMLQCTGFSENVVSQMIESYLIKSGLIKITGRGRSLTTLGFSILGKDAIEEKEIIMNIETSGTNREIPQATTTTANTVIVPDIEINASDLVSRIGSGEIKTMQQIAAKYGLTYGKHNNYMRNVLDSIGYTVKKRVGLVKKG